MESGCPTIKGYGTISGENLTEYLQIGKSKFAIPELDVGFTRLIAFMNRFRGAIPTALEQTDLHFSSA
jgi:hypothetical protein